MTHRHWMAAFYYVAWRSVMWTLSASIASRELLCYLHGSAGSEHQASGLVAVV